jgi:hypothetical protein
MLQQPLQHTLLIQWRELLKLLHENFSRFAHGTNLTPPVRRSKEKTCRSKSRY